MHPCARWMSMGKISGASTAQHRLEETFGRLKWSVWVMNLSRTLQARSGFTRTERRQAERRKLFCTRSEQEPANAQLRQAEARHKGRAGPGAGTGWRQCLAARGHVKWRVFCSRAAVRSWGWRWGSGGTGSTAAELGVRKRAGAERRNVRPRAAGRPERSPTERCRWRSTTPDGVPPRDV